jgi:predicted  nucleic acid-binding Zn-ribbon protein
LVTKISSSTTKGVTLREDVTKLKTLIDTKTAELLELTKTLGSKQEFAEKNPTVTTTTGQISELKVEIETIEKLIKTTRKEYVAAYAESASLQRLIDHFTTQKREYEEEVRQNEELIEEQKAIIVEQEENAKLRKTVEDTTKAQVLVFTSHQKVVEIQEELSEAKKTKEDKLAALNTEKDTKDKELKTYKEELKKLEGQKATLESTLKTTTGKTEITRITQEITGITTGITKATTKITGVEQQITGITTDVTSVTTEWTSTITDLTTKLTSAKADAEKDEEAAAKAVNKLPGTPGSDVKITGGVMDSKAKSGSNQYGGKSSSSKTTATATVSTTSSKTETATVGGPTSGITDVASTVVKVTEEAKKKRVNCTRATKRLANQKDIIAKAVKDTKEEIGEHKKVVEECKTKLKDEQLEYAKTQADANAIAAKDPTKFQELTMKLKALQLAMDNETKKCSVDEEDVEAMFKKIQGKSDEVEDLVKFVGQACAEASQSEDEVAQTIGIITQIEVVNRLYGTYINSVQALGNQEKLNDQKKAMYERERARVSTLLQETKRRIQTAESTIVTLNTQEKELSSKSTAKETTIKEQVTKIKVLITQQEEIIKTETSEETKATKVFEELEEAWKKTLKENSKLKRDLKRSQESYEDSQRKLRKEVEVKTKIDEYRKKVESGKKTLVQKDSQIA